RPAPPCSSRRVFSPSTTASRPLRWRSSPTSSTESFSACSSRRADMRRPQLPRRDSTAGSGIAGAPQLPSIGDYGLIGDTRTAALVSSDGAIDWLCAPRFDGEPFFGRLVGGPPAGTFRVGPAGAAAVVERRYRRHTATLETTWAVGERRLTL